MMVSGIRITQEEAIRRFKKVHGDKYDYSNTTYVDAKTKLRVTCKIHGEFQIIAHAHYKAGCAKCAKLQGASKLRKDTAYFIEMSRKVHGNKYDYSLTEYTTSYSKVTIVCPSHGKFDQRAAAHMRGKGCKLCQAEKTRDRCKHTLEQFIIKARQVHGNLYDYSQAEYVTTHTKIRIICKEHGVFLQKPSHHCSGVGCPNCGSGGFSPNEEGVLYVIQSDDITKVGISNKDADRRLRDVTISSGRTFTKVRHYKAEGLVIVALEKEILKSLREQYKQPNFVFDGYTECFYDVNLSWLLNIVESKLKELNECKER